MPHPHGLRRGTFDPSPSRPTPLDQFQGGVRPLPLTPGKTKFGPSPARLTPLDQLQLGGVRHAGETDGPSSNPFLGAFEEDFPRAIFGSRVSQLGRPFGQTRTLQGLFGSVYDQFLSALFSQSQAGQGAGLTFDQFLSGPTEFSDFGGFDQFIGGLTPSQRGLFSSPFAPRTRFNFGGQRQGF